MDERNNPDERAAQAALGPGPQPAPEGPQAGTVRDGPTGAGRHDGEAGQAGPDVRELQDRVRVLEDRWRRAMAELDNQRKRCERQLEQVGRAERDRVTAAWLPVVDHLELALQHAQADPASIVAGVRAVHVQALDVLLALGYRRLDQVGARFDPTVHDAAQVVQDPEAEPNTVVAVLRPGYAIDSGATDAGATDGGLLRPAVVTVATGPGSAGEGTRAPETAGHEKAGQE